MAADGSSAWIAAGASIVVSLISLGAAVWANLRADQTRREQDATARQLETLKSHLSGENDAAKAKRDYEYEARKRLYAELYPLAFHLNEAAIGAQNRIISLARAARKGSLAANADNWLTGTDPYYFNAVIYALVAPLAVYDLMSRKLTMLDLTLDESLHRVMFIARQAYRAMRSDFDLLDKPYPPLAFSAANDSYRPPENPPAHMPPSREQRWKWRQGLYSGQISQAVDALLISTGTTTTVMTFAEFAKALGKDDLRTPDDPRRAVSPVKIALRPIAEIFRDFHPARRPVTWRILLAQAACYRAIIAVSAQGEAATATSVASAAHLAGAEDRAAFDWIGTSGIPPDLSGWIDFVVEHESAMATADLYIEAAFKEFADRYKPARPAN